MTRLWLRVFQVMDYSSKQTVLTPSVGAQVGDLPATIYPFEWALGDFVGKPDQRIAILVTSEVNGIPCQMQLDTGANSVVAWHHYTPSAGKPTDVTVEFGGISNQVPAALDTLESLNGCAQRGPIGTLGNGFFDHGTLSINLKAARIGFMPGATLSLRPDARPMLYAKWPSTGGHTLVEVQADDGTVKGYDNRRGRLASRRACPNL